MQSLLEKVKEVELEATEMVEAAKKAGSQGIATIQANEQKMLAETKKRAEERAKAVITELVAATKEEVNKLKQEREQALQAISSSSEAKRDQALAYASQQFESRFLGA